MDGKLTSPAPAPALLQRWIWNALAWSFFDARITSKPLIVA